MNYYVKRIFQSTITLLVVMTISFVLFRMMPGGPIQSLVAEQMQECVQAGLDNCEPSVIREQVKSRVSIDPDVPIPIAYANFLTDVVLHQDFGQSIRYNRPVFDILFKAMPWSVFISLYGLALGYVFNIFFGAAMAYKEGSRFDSFGTIFAMVGNSIPYYVAAIVSLAYLGYELNIFPTGGRTPQQMALVVPGLGELASWAIIEPGFNVPYMLGIAWHGALPILTGFVLGISGLGMRGNAIRVMGSDYIRVARLRGLSQSRIASRYVARNAILPMYTGFMIGIAGIFSSNIIMERIFTYPAVGWYTFQALETRDYPLLMGSFLFYTAITLIGITVADFTYGLIDPRASHGGDE